MIIEFQIEKKQNPEGVILLQMDSITARGFYVRCALRGYNNVNPTGLLEIQEGLTELKEMKKNPEGMK